MYQNEYIISTDLKRKMTSVVPQFVQYDKAVLIFKIYDNGIPFPIEEVTEIEVTNLRPDGKAIVGFGVPVQLDDDSWAIKYTYLGSEMRKIGTNKVGLSMFKGEDKVSILPFDVHIVQDPREIAGSSQSEEDVGLLTQLIQSVRVVLEEATEVIKEANQAIQDVQVEIGNVTELGEDLTVEIERSQTQTALAKDATNKANAATQSANSAASNATTQADRAKESADLAEPLVTKMQQYMGNVEGLENKGAYNSATTYSKNNIISHDGSSYMSLIDDNLNNPTTDTSSWELIARKGLDGKGLVVTVNKKAPDTNGDVQLTPSDIDAVSTSHLTDIEPHTYGNYTIRFNPAKNSLDFVKVK